MAIYWSFSGIPELAAKGEAERKAIIKKVSTLAVKHWEWWLALLAAGVLVAAGSWFGGRGVSSAIGAGLGGALGGAFHHLAVIYVARKYYAHALAGLGDA